ncbi:MAG: Alanine dehydrogenase [Planctomycetes bacterium]|nr:Alanine dehydrogenase [Planctomycetota bacterium]
MLVGVPKEIKNNENRVAIVPAGVDALRQDGHRVVVQKGAGLGSGITDEEFVNAGAEIAPNAKKVWSSADMIMKVKEPLPEEYGLIRKGQTVFTYFHFAASRQLTEGMIATGSICVAYETVEHGTTLPLLTPMSEVAGRMAIQQGAKFLEKPQMGRGILLGGIPGVEPATVAVIGGGIVGTNAAKMAAGLGARVIVLDVNLDRLRYLDDVMPANVTTMYSNSYNIRKVIRYADLVVGAVLIPGAKAPALIRRADLKTMNEGSVIVDVAIDQGGCVETAKPTTHSEPTYLVDGVVHYCVANMPGAVGRTSTYGLTNTTLPYARILARHGWKAAAQQNHGIRTGLNVVAGKVTYKGVSDAFGMAYTPVENVLN